MHILNKAKITVNHNKKKVSTYKKVALFSLQFNFSYANIALNEC